MPSPAADLIVLNDELLPLIALGFAPKPTVPRNIGCVHPLRDDALGGWRSDQQRELWLDELGWERIGSISHRLPS
jgi:hypothetical protein